MPILVSYYSSAIGVVGGPGLSRSRVCIDVACRVSAFVLKMPLSGLNIREYILNVFIDISVVFHVAVCLLLASDLLGVGIP